MGVQVNNSDIVTHQGIRITKLIYNYTCTLGLNN